MEYDTASDSYIDQPFTAGFSLGAGFGIETLLFRHFSQVFEIGYIGGWSSVEGDFADQLSLDLVLHGSIRYRF